jgi:uncharacterized protein (TIGR00304 family)
MRLKWPAVLLICLGLALIAASVLTGEAKVGIVVIIPVIYGGGVLLLGGVLCVMAGIMLFFFSSSQGSAEDDAGTGQEGHGENRTERRGGGVLLIGPVPIIFGTDKGMALVAAAIAIIALALIVIMLL